jgi:hypothetical protein
LLLARAVTEDAGLSCEATSIDLKAFLTQAKQKKTSKESTDQTGE